MNQSPDPFLSKGPHSIFSMQVFREQVEAVFRFSPITILLTLLLSPVIAWRVHAHSQAMDVVVWWAVISGLSLLRALLGSLFKSKDPATRDDEHWIGGFLILNFLIGLAWGALALPWVTADPPERAVLMGVLIAIPSLALFSLSPLRRTYIGFVAPIVSCMATGALLELVPLPVESMLLALLYGIASIVAANRLCANFVQMTAAKLQMAAYAEQAVAGNRAKSNFLARMSHEIRTPLNGMLGMAQLFLRSQTLPDQVRLANQMLDSGNDLLHVFDNVLDFARLEAGAAKLVSARVCLPDVLKVTLSPLHQAANAKSLMFEVDLDSSMPTWVEIDQARLTQLLRHLLDNAIKFTATGKVALRISATQTETPEVAQLRFEVHDTGVGIASEKQKHLFDAFSQADETNTRKFGGTGLGLAIVAEITDLMAGTLGFESKAGEGSMFWVQIPTKTLSDQSPENVPSSSAAVSMPSLVGSVLLVEDSPLNYEIAAAALESFGLTVIGAKNGKEAIEQFREHAPQLILMDCQMPVMDGLDATRNIRAWEKNQNLRRTPIVALTAHALPEEKIACFDAGMDDFLTKPVFETVLQQTLVKWIGK